MAGLALVLTVLKIAPPPFCQELTTKRTKSVTVASLKPLHKKLQLLSTHLDFIIITLIVFYSNKHRMQFAGESKPQPFAAGKS